MRTLSNRTDVVEVARTPSLSSFAPDMTPGPRSRKNAVRRGFAPSSAEEVRACLGPLGVWLESTIKSRCLLEPADIDEVLFALIPISREAFDVAVVVRSKNDLKRSELIDKFDGELVDKPRLHYVGAERAWAN